MTRETWVHDLDRMWWVDPGDGGWSLGTWGLTNEAFGMCGVGADEGFVSHGNNLVDAAMVDDCRRQQADAGVVVHVVVPVEQRLAVGARILDRAKAVREARPVFEGLELCLGVRVVVGDARSTVALADAEIGVEQREGFGGHRSAAIGVDGDLARLDALTVVGILAVKQIIAGSSLQPEAKARA